MTASWVRAGQGVEGLSKKEKGLVDMDKSMVTVGGMGIRELNGNGKNTIKTKNKIKFDFKNII